MPDIELQQAENKKPQETPASARLAVILSLMAGVETEEDMQAFREKVKQINAMSDEEITALLGGAGSPSGPRDPLEPVQHARYSEEETGDFLAYLREGDPIHGGKGKSGSEGKEKPWQQARCLARFYAGLLSAIETVGGKIPRHEIEEAREDELEPFGWTVKRHGDRSWYVADIDEDGEHGKEEKLTYRRVAKDTPGAVPRYNNIGQMYWIDSDQASREAVRKLKRGRKRKKKIKPNRDFLRRRLKLGAGVLRLSDKGKQRAQEALEHLRRVHEGNTLRRLDEIVSLAEAALKRADGVSDKILLAQQMVKLRYMEGLLEEDGVEDKEEPIVGEVDVASVEPDAGDIRKLFEEAARQASDPHTRKSLLDQAGK